MPKRKWTIVVNADHEPCDVLIGRGTQWGNPFYIGKDGDRDAVIEKHRQWVLKHPNYVGSVKLYLSGKVLGCPGNCKPLPCHGDVYVEICNGRRRITRQEQHEGRQADAEGSEAEGQRARGSQGSR